MLETLNEKIVIIAAIVLLICAIAYGIHIGNIRLTYRRLKKEDIFFKQKGIEKNIDK